MSHLLPTIRKRLTAKGGEAHQAIVRIKRQGKLVYQEARSFSRRALAKAWAEDLEKALKRPGQIEARQVGGITVAGLIRRYIEFVDPVHPLGRTKRATLEALAVTEPLASRPVAEVGSEDLIAFAKQRRQAGVAPQTIAQDIIYLRMPFAMAKPAWGVLITATHFDEAMPMLKQLQLVAEPNKRERRPTLDELRRLYELFRKQRHHPSARIPIEDLCEYAIWTGKREGEICRLLWSDFNEGERTQLLRDMKHPRNKRGNDFRFPLLGDAWAITQRQLKIDERIFPYKSDSVSSRFTNACRTLGIDDLHFHDLRRECVSRLFEQGYVPHEVAQVTGHRDLNTLWEIYTKLDPALHEQSRRRREARERSRRTQRSRR